MDNIRFVCLLGPLNRSGRSVLLRSGVIGRSLSTLRNMAVGYRRFAIHEDVYPLRLRQRRGPWVHVQLPGCNQSVDVVATHAVRGPAEEFGQADTRLSRYHRQSPFSAVAISPF